MNKPLFLRIVDRFSNEVSYFVQRVDATGRPGHSALQKCIAAIRRLAYGLSADAMDEYLRIGETTAGKCLDYVVDGVITLFEDEYMRRPTVENLQRLLENGETRGFPGMVGTIDCTLNDINVLDRSPVFNDILEGRAREVNYTVNGRQYNMAYYLTDGIYPKRATFIQSISQPQGLKASLFSTQQEGVRKDVERGFGVLQARFAIIKNPALSWDNVKIGKIMKACIILHNMIVKDERDHDTETNPLEFRQEEGSSTSQVNYAFARTTSTIANNMLANRARVREKKMHLQLKADLVEHIWQKFSRAGQ